MPVTNNINQERPELPKLPVPQLQHTLDTYLKCMEHLVPEELFRKTKAIVETFGVQGGVGELLQNELVERSNQKDNWVYDYWLDDMYLKNRLALPVNSSPVMVFPKQPFKEINDALRFASQLILKIVDFKDLLDKRALPLDFGRGKLDGTPLCMEQYYRLFSCYRMPGSEKDKLLFQQTSPASESDYIIVACKNQFFVLDLSMKSQSLDAESVFLQLEKIMAIADKEEQCCPCIGLLTADERKHWAEAREALLRDPTSRFSLGILERSLCLLCLDEASGTELNDTDRAMQMLHGGGRDRNGGNRWYDKPMQLVVGLDGSCGVVCEHSPFEGIVLVKCVEYLMSSIEVTSAGEVSQRVTCELPTPQRLQWKSSPKLQGFLASSADRLQKLVRNLDMNVFRFTAYGKEFIKTQKMSPDAYIQLLIQLAFYRCNGKLVSTYESASTRSFCQGRVDNIRSATREALAFVRSMTSTIPDTERMKMLWDAIHAQTSYTMRAVTGMGIDNHLLGLREIAKELKMESPELFRDETYRISNQFVLSTSQVPTTMEMFCCYGPVSPHGYGICYNPQSHCIVFSVTSFRNSTETCSSTFVKALEESLCDVRELCCRCGAGEVNGSQRRAL